MTARGAYFYWYETIPTVPLAPETSLRALDAAFASAGVPVQYYQLDAWWYACTGWNACMQCWAPNGGEAAPNSTGCSKVGVGPYFGNGGLPALKQAMVTNALGWSLYHNYVCPKSRMWTAHGGRFGGVPSEGGEYKLPTAEESEAFYRTLFADGKREGMCARRLPQALRLLKPTCHGPARLGAHKRMPHAI